MCPYSVGGLVWMPFFDLFILPLQHSDNQNDTFYNLKDHLLECKRRSFSMQYAVFQNAKDGMLFCGVSTSHHLTCNHPAVGSVFLYNQNALAACRYALSR